MPAGEVAQLADRGARLLARAAHELGDLRPVVQALLGAAQSMLERDEPRLRAVVEVALDAPQLRRLDVERAAAGPRQLVDALDELALARLGQPLAVHDDPVRAERQREAEHRPRRPERPEARERPDHDEDRADEPGDLGVDDQRLLARGRAAAGVEDERVDREQDREPEPDPDGPELAAAGGGPDDRDEDGAAGCSAPRGARAPCSRRCVAAGRYGCRGRRSRAVHDPTRVSWTTWRRGPRAPSGRPRWGR